MPPKPLSLNIPEKQPPSDISDSGTWKITDSMQIGKDGIKQKTLKDADGKESKKSVYLDLKKLEKVDTLGKGQFGTVDLMKHTDGPELFARKTVPMPSTVGEKKMITQELLALRRVKSRYTVTFYTAYLAESFLYIIMEYMNGGTIAQMLRRAPGGRVPEPVAACIACDILKGIDYLHRGARLIHRDIKPENILLTTDGVAKISDFGLAANLAGTLPTRETFVGTAPYMSPERLRGSEYTPSSDIWSAGLTFMEMLLGHHPYFPKARRGVKFFDILKTITESETPRLAPGSFSPECVHFFTVCLHADPYARKDARTLLRHKWLAPHYADSDRRHRTVKAFIDSLAA